MSGEALCSFLCLTCCCSCFLIIIAGSGVGQYFLIEQIITPKPAVPCPTDLYAIINNINYVAEDSYSVSITVSGSSITAFPLTLYVDNRTICNYNLYGHLKNASAVKLYEKCTIGTGSRFSYGHDYYSSNEGYSDNPSDYSFDQTYSVYDPSGYVELSVVVGLISICIICICGCCSCFVLCATLDEFSKACCSKKQEEQREYNLQDNDQTNHVYHANVSDSESGSSADDYYDPLLPLKVFI